MLNAADCFGRRTEALPHAPFHAGEYQGSYAMYAIPLIVVLLGVVGAYLWFWTAVLIALGRALVGDR